MTTFAKKHYPEHNLHGELDHYLDRGWYRMGQTIFTTHFLFYGEHFYSAIWIRLALDDYQYSKRLRKLKRRNEAKFRYEFGMAVINAEKEKLYQKYRANFPGIIAPSLKDSLLDGEEYNVFRTREVCIYHQDELVAFSFFDLGKTSAAGIIGVYDPAFAKYSLGLYSMILEIEYCLQKRFRFYYPGYVVPGNSRFDYKLRIGEVDYFNISTQDWHPFTELAEEQIPIRKMYDRLTYLQTELTANNITTRLLNYPLFEANLFGFWEAPYLDFPIVLQLSGVPRDDDSHLLLVYDVRIHAYTLLHCIPFDDLYFKFNENYANTFDADHYFLELVIISKTLAKFKRVEDAVFALRQMEGNVQKNN